VLYAVLYFFFRQAAGAAILAFYLLSGYLFFGFIQDICKSYMLVLSRYIVLLPLFLTGFALLCLYVTKRNSQFPRLRLLLNLLLIIYIFIDTGKLLLKSPGNLKKDSSNSGMAAAVTYKRCADCPTPDIYFLLFDAYTGSRSLKKRYHFNNDELDSFLLKRGFSIQYSSRSNYFFTAFSMASILNMSYLKGIPDEKAVTVDDYNRCTNLVKNNLVTDFMSKQGYKIVNYSVFDLVGNPTPVNETFLPLKTKLITASTMFPRMQKDLGWIWTGNALFKTRQNNEKLLNAVKEESSRSSVQPRFVYAHIYLPHAPFYYNQNGQLRNEEDLIRKSREFSLQGYLEYLPYTNSKVKDLIQTILTNTGGKAVIVFMGDHGFNNDVVPIDSAYTFQNQNAVYFPGKDYHLLYDSITGVNQFRALFNQLFKQHFPLLSDSVIILKDKK